MATAAKKRKRMRCPRCNGYMGYKLMFLAGDFHDMWYCCNCGDYVDEKIIKHRLLGVIGEYPA